VIFRSGPWPGQPALYPDVGASENSDAGRRGVSRTPAEGGEGGSGSSSDGGRDLSERVKELNCLYAVSRVLHAGDASCEDTIQSVVELVPTGWQHCGLACARVTLGDVEYSSPGFRDTPWRQQTPLVVRGKALGAVTVCYREECPAEDEGPFLVEERELLNSIAQHLGESIERSRTNRQLLAYQQDLRSLAAALSMAEQRERRRIAEALHDEVGLALALLNMHLWEPAEELTAERARSLLERARNEVADIMATVRTLTFDLCPPVRYELGFGPALEWLTEQAGEQYGYATHFAVRGCVDELGDETRLVLFKATRELLANVGKHASAYSVTVEVEAGPDCVCVVVTDDGVGFDVSRLDRPSVPTGLGLFAVKERLEYMGGSVMVASDEAGTSVRLCAPYSCQEAEHD